MVIPIYTLKLVSLQLPHRVAHAVRSQTCQQLHLSIMPSFAHYFKEKDFSDCELIVQQRPKGHDVQEEAPKRTCTGTAARPVLEPWRQPQRLVAFPAHQMILCTCKYFNAQVGGCSMACSADMNGLLSAGNALVTFTPAICWLAQGWKVVLKSKVSVCTC